MANQLTVINVQDATYGATANGVIIEGLAIARSTNGTLALGPPLTLSDTFQSTFYRLLDGSSSFLGKLVVVEGGCTMGNGYLSGNRLDRLVTFITDAVATSRKLQVASLAPIPGSGPLSGQVPNAVSNTAYFWDTEGSRG